MVCIIKGWLSKANPLFFFPLILTLVKGELLLRINLSKVLCVHPQPLFKSKTFDLCCLLSVYWEEAEHVSSNPRVPFLPTGGKLHLGDGELILPISKAWLSGRTPKLLHLLSKHLLCSYNSTPAPRMLSVKWPAIAPHCPFREDNRMYWKEGTALSLATKQLWDLRQVQASPWGCFLYCTRWLYMCWEEKWLK